MDPPVGRLALLSAHMMAGHSASPEGPPCSNASAALPGRTVVLAQEETRGLNHNYVGSEHLLLALTGDKELAGQALDTL